MSSDIAKHRERVVEPEPSPELPTRDACAAVHRPGEPKWADELGRRAKQYSPFATRFEHEMKEPVFQVAHAAVDESRRAARRPAGEIVAFDECDREAAQRGVARNSSPGDSAAHDEQIERVG